MFLSVNCAYSVERVSKDAVEALNSKEIILTFPSQKKNNKTVRVLKIPKTESSARKVFIPRSVAQYLIELKQEQDEIKAALGNEYHDYNNDKFDAEEVIRLLKRLNELESQTDIELEAEEALRDFWKYVEEREWEERIISGNDHKNGNL